MDTQILSKRIKELRQKLNLTQREFTEELSITPATLSAYEKSTVNPSISVIVEIAKKYNVSVDWLLGLSDTTVTQNSIKTYADLVKFLVDISKTDMKIVVQESYLEYTTLGEPVIHYCGILFDTRNKDFEQFFEDYNKMNLLYKNNSIDEEVYNLWLEKTLNKFENIAINDCEDLPF
ncbi:MAG: helix-turn-helix transcriptional regulator [Clostridia bacterium]|nr:helix-turn-helix transcriptional regulator [Clostridia bacterium]